MQKREKGNQPVASEVDRLAAKAVEKMGRAFTPMGRGKMLADVIHVREMRRLETAAAKLLKQEQAELRQAAKRPKFNKRIPRFGGRAKRQFGPIGVRPPISQIVLRNLEMGRVYQLGEILCMCPDWWCRSARPHLTPGRGRRPQRMFWPVYNWYLVGVLGYDKKYHPECATDLWLTRRVWLTAEGERWRDVCRANWAYRFISSCTVHRAINWRGMDLDQVFEKFIAMAKPIERTQVKNSWVRRPPGDTLGKAVARGVDRCGW